VFEDGRQLRDFVHVTDVARANVLASRSQRREFRAYNIASGTPCTIGEVATALASAADGPPPITTGDYRLGDARHIVADPSRARDELSFSAEVIWPEGIQDFATQPMRAPGATRGSYVTLGHCSTTRKSTSKCITDSRPPKTTEMNAGNTVDEIGRDGGSA